MSVILKEWGFGDQTRNLQHECPGFRCPTGCTDCCVRRTVYSKATVATVFLKERSNALEVRLDVLFLPKFHPELNFIEQCWGRAKWSYRQLPASLREEDLEMNALKSLNLVPLPLMRQ
jgi:hypothetical protein